MSILSELADLPGVICAGANSLAYMRLRFSRFRNIAVQNIYKL